MWVSRLLSMRFREWESIPDSVKNFQGTSGSLWGRPLTGYGLSLVAVPVAIKWKARGRVWSLKPSEPFIPGPGPTPFLKLAIDPFLLTPPLPVCSVPLLPSLHKLFLLVTSWGEGWFSKMKTLPPAFLNLFSMWLYSLPPLLILLFLIPVLTSYSVWGTGMEIRGFGLLLSSTQIKSLYSVRTRYLICKNKGRVNWSVSPSTSFLGSM